MFFMEKNFFLHWELNLGGSNVIIFESEPLSPELFSHPILEVGLIY